MLERLSEDDLFGRFYLKKIPDEGPFKNYYASLDAIRPLVKGRRWLDSVTAYYMNAAVTRNALRLSFFTSRPEDTVKAVEGFISVNNLEHSGEPEYPHAAVVSALYGNEELRFRRFLYISTLVMLDLMESDLSYARSLFAKFRFQFMSSGEHYENHFLKAFEERSPAYRALTDAEKRQFWLDLKNWPNPPQVDWIHLPVNMVLGCDINSFGKWQEFISSNYTSKPEEMARLLEQVAKN
jgi:hypothetical protein